MLQGGLFPRSHSRNARGVSLPMSFALSLCLPDNALPILVVEGGWASVKAGGSSSAELQARYIRRQIEMADRAKLTGLFQLTFTDIDVASYGSSGAPLIPFASLGLVTTEFADKPALAEWDRAFGRRFGTP